MSALALQQSATAVSPGMSASFLATGGTAPYTYSVVAGGAGGTIDSDGFYTAPTGVTGTDTIRATDAAAATASLPILIGTALELFCDIIRKEMGLSSDQVMIYDQKFQTPNDSRVYVAVAVLICKPFGNTTRFASNGSGLDAEQSVNMLARLDVNIQSRSIDALNRKEEIVLALNSVYSQQQQAANSFYVAPLPSAFVSLSQVDGAAIPYRFVISVNIQYLFKKTKAVQSFNSFDTEIVTDPETVTEEIIF